MKRKGDYKESIHYKTQRVHRPMPYKMPISAGALAAMRRSSAPRLPAGEMKFFDTTLSFNIDATGEIPATGQLSLIRLGTSESNHIGRKCTVKSIQARMNLVFTPAAAATASVVTYIYLILDKQCNGAVATVAGDANSVFDSTDLRLALRLRANQERFVFLKSWTRVFNAAAGVTTAYNNHSQQIDWFGKCNIQLDFGADAGAITDLRSNNIFLIAGSNGPDDLVNCAGKVRLNFLDQ